VSFTTNLNENSKWRKEKKGGIPMYGKAKREQKKAEQNRGTGLQKEKFALKKSP